MSIRLDLAVFNRNDEVDLLIEVKKILHTTPEWATRFRQAIIANGTLPVHRYFLLAMPDRFYLWKGSDCENPDALPTYTVDAQPILKPYFDQVGISVDQISGIGFERVVALWLGDLIYSDSPAASGEWVIDSGLRDAVAGGRLAQEAVA